MQTAHGNGKCGQDGGKQIDCQQCHANQNANRKYIPMTVFAYAVGCGIGDKGKKDADKKNKLYQPIY